MSFAAKRERRAAAQLIYAELTVNLAEVMTLINTGLWPSTTGQPRHAVWDAYATKLLTSRGIQRVAHISSAYSALDLLAWLSDVEGFTEEDHSELILTIRLGAYEVGRISRMTDAELAAREVWDEAIRKERAHLEGLVRDARPNVWKRARNRFKR